jgi:hypothetical protein
MPINWAELQEIPAAETSTQPDVNVVVNNYITPGVGSTYTGHQIFTSTAKMLEAPSESFATAVCLNDESLDGVVTSWMFIKSGVTATGDKIRAMADGGGFVRRLE